MWSTPLSRRQSCLVCIECIVVVACALCCIATVAVARELVRGSDDDGLVYVHLPDVECVRAVTLRNVWTDRSRVIWSSSFPSDAPDHDAFQLSPDKTAWIQCLSYHVVSRSCVAPAFDFASHALALAPPVVDLCRSNPPPTDADRFYEFVIQSCDDGANTRPNVRAFIQFALPWSAYCDANASQHASTSQNRSAFYTWLEVAVVCVLVLLVAADRCKWYR